MPNYPLLIFLLILFIVTGYLLPRINVEYDMGEIPDNTIDTSRLDSYNPITLGTTVWSIAKMFLWTFGALPWWLDMIFLIFRLTFWFMIVELVWIG